MKCACKAIAATVLTLTVMIKNGYFRIKMRKSNARDKIKLQLP